MLKRVLKHLKTLIIGVLKTADLHYLKSHKQHLMLFLQNLLIFFLSWRIMDWFPNDKFMSHDS